MHSLPNIAIALVKKKADQRTKQQDDQFIAELESMIEEFENQGDDGGE